MDQKLFNYLKDYKRNAKTVSDFMNDYPFDEPEPHIVFDDIVGMPTNMLKELTTLLEEVDERMFIDIVEDVEENVKSVLRERGDGNRHETVNYMDSLEELEGNLYDQVENIRFSKELLGRAIEFREQLEEYTELSRWISALKSASPSLFNHIMVLLENTQNTNLQHSLTDEIAQAIATMHNME